MKMPRKILTPLMPAFLVVLAACTQQQPPIQPFDEKISQKFEGLMQQHDEEKLSLMYTEDAKLMPPYQPVIEGRLAIRNFWHESFALEGLPIELDARDRIAAGDYVYRDGVLTFHWKDGRTEIGKFMQFWKYVDGTWKLHRVMWNVSTPMSIGETPKPASPPETTPRKK
jgi:ketosteroid isomerase-like protein